MKLVHVFGGIVDATIKWRWITLWILLLSHNHLPIMSTLVNCCWIITFVMRVGCVDEDAVCDSRWTVIIVVSDRHREELIVVRRGRVLVSEVPVRTRSRRNDVVMRVDVVWLVAVPTINAASRRCHRCRLLKCRECRCRVNCLSGNLRWWTVICVYITCFAWRFTFSPFGTSVLWNVI